MRGRVVMTVVATALSMACATTGGGGSAGSTRVSDAGSASGSRTSSSGQDLITESDITSRAADAANALQVIQKLRPQMLRSRGLASPTDVTGESSRPKVYVDNISYGDLGSLTNVNASQIREIRYVNARDATTQWGTGHMGGVILVLTKK